jgi:iron complex outermembrane receptor protein
MFGADALGGVLYFIDEPFERNEEFKLNYNSLFESSNLYTNNQISTKWSSNNFQINAYAEYGKSSDYRLPEGKFLYNSRFENRAVKIIMGYSKKRWLVNAKYQLNNNFVGIPGHTHESEPSAEDLTSSTSFRHKTRPAQFVSNQIANIENTYLFDRSKLKLDLSYTLNQLQEYEAWTVPEIDLNLSTNQWNLRWYKEIKNNIKLTLGSQGSNQT